MSKILNLVLFADDTNLFCSGKNLEQLLDALETELDSLKRWFNLNKLSLKINKIKYIIFGHRNFKNFRPIMLDNTEIERVYENRYLGVVIDPKNAGNHMLIILKLKFITFVISISHTAICGSLGENI